MTPPREFLLKLFSMYPVDTFNFCEFLISTPTFGATTLVETTTFGELFIGMWDKKLSIIVSAKAKFVSPNDNVCTTIKPFYLDAMLKTFLEEKDTFKKMLVFI